MNHTLSSIPKSLSALLVILAFSPVNRAAQTGESTSSSRSQNAIKAIAEGKNDQAIAAIERATGKINVLVARNPSTALIPVEVEVTVIDAAPIGVKAIREIAKMAEYAVEDRDYPKARVLLRNLTSEIRVRTYNLPL